MTMKKSSATRRNMLEMTGLTLCSALLGGTAGSVAGEEAGATSPDFNLEPPAVASGESRAAQVEWYMRNGLSGGRAVLAVYADVFHFPREVALKITGGFSGGIGHMGEVCGMVIAGAMLLGLKHESANITEKESHKKTIELTRQFSRDFQEQYQSVRCRELLQVDLEQLNTPERYAKAHEDGTFDVCFQGANTIADLLENKYDIFDRNNKENTL
jgi:Putative redox-active protein (C_GCAxxG_C_C).